MSVLKSREHLIKENTNYRLNNLGFYPTELKNSIKKNISNLG